MRFCRIDHAELLKISNNDLFLAQPTPKGTVILCFHCPVFWKGDIADSLILLKT